MPTIEFRVGRIPDLWEEEIKRQILSYMLFPNNERQQQGYLAYWGGWGRDAWREATQERVAADIRRKHGQETISEIPPEQWQAVRQYYMNTFTEDCCDPFGGTATITQLPTERKLQKYIDSAFYDWLRVGILFRLLIDFQHYYQRSVSLADIFPVFKKHPAFRALRPREHFQDKVLYDLWKKYKKVAHFCAALSFLSIGDYRDCLSWKRHGIEPFSGEHRAIIVASFIFPEGEVFNSTASATFTGRGINLLLFLMLIQEYQAFGRTYKPGQSSHFLIPEDGWLLKEAEKLHGLPVNTPPASFRCIFEKYSRASSA